MTAGPGSSLGGHLRSVASRPFVRKISGMMALTAIGQGMYLLAGPLIGRLYSPEEMGYYGLFFTVWTIGSLLVCLMYDIAVPAVADDEDARQLTAASIVVGVMLSVVIGAAFGLASSLSLFGLHGLPLWGGALMALCLIVQFLLQLTQNWRIRGDQVLLIGKANVVLNAARSIGQVAGGFFAPLWSMLIAGEVLGRVLAIFQLKRGSARSDRGALTSLSSVIDTLKRHRQYPMIFGPAVVLDSAVLFIQMAMLGAMFGPASLGQFFLMRRTLDLPVAFAFKSLSDLFYARQVNDARDRPHSVRPFFVKAALALAAVGMIAGLPVMVFGPELFALFYGHDWRQAGTLAAIMMPAFILNLAVAPISRVFTISAQPLLRIAPSVAALAGTLAILVAGRTYAFNLVEVTIGLSIVISAQYLVYFAAGYIAAGKLR